MKKVINLISLVMLVSINVLTPFSYAQQDVGNNSCDYNLYGKCYNVEEGTTYADIISPSEYGIWYVNGEEFENFDDEIGKNNNVEIYFRWNDGIIDNDRIIYGYDESQKPVITIYDENFEYGVTISAINEGTNTPGLDIKSFGKYFQRGNNHGQSNHPNTGSALAEWDGSYSNHGYDGPVSNFIISQNENRDYWSDNLLHDDLWGGEDDGQENNWGYDMINHIVTNVEGRQGPCGEGYHVPSIGERNELIKLQVLASNVNCDGILERQTCPLETSEFRGFEMASLKFRGHDTDWPNLLLPKAGELYRDSEGSYYFNEVGYNWNYGCQASYWTSTPQKNVSFGYYCAPFGLTARNDAGSVRCFKNEYSPIYEVQFSDMGNIIDVQNIMEGNKVTQLEELKRNGYIFLGWYKDEEGTEEWNFDTDIVSGDIIIYAKWQECEEGYKVSNNQCVIEESIGVKYEDGLIKVSDGIDAIYIKDRNQGAEISYGLPPYIYSYYLEIQVNNGIITMDEAKEEMISYTNNLMGTNFTDINDVVDYIYDRDYTLDLYDEDSKYTKSFGTSYYRGNNTGAEYNKLNVNILSGTVDISDELKEKGFSGGKMGLQGEGWIDGNINPCDASKGEYLPTVEDWKRLMEIWANNKGFNVETGQNYYNINTVYIIDNDNNYPAPVFLFLQDMLIPVSVTFFDGDLVQIPLLWSSKGNENNEIGLFSAEGGPLLLYGDADLFSFYNSYAGQVRCFVELPDTFLVTYDSNGGSDVENQNVVSGNVATEPSAPTKAGYTFDGWYKDKILTEKWDFDNDVVTDDITLYAKWVENKPSGSSSGGGGGGGGGSSNKTDVPKEDKTQTDTTEQTSQNDKQEIQDSSEQVPQKDVNTSIDSQQTKQASTNTSEGQTYTQEFQKAYEFAKGKGITTMPTIQKADMNGKLTRIAMAKMLSQYAINILGKNPDISKGTVDFKDVTKQMDRQYDNGVTLAYQLGIMGQNMPNNRFRPNDEVTRAEFVTALSRLVYGTTDGNYKGTGKYYIHHMEKMVKEGIITNDDPNMKELRGYVMIMLMRSVK